MKEYETYNGKGYFDMSDRKLWLLVFVTITLCLILLYLCSCISASSMTGSDVSSKIKAEQTSSQGTTSSDSVSLDVQPTTITFTDLTGNKMIVATGGGRASTGSKTMQQTDMLSELSATTKASAEASAKSSFSLTVLLVIAGFIALILLLFELYRIKKGIF